MSEYDRLQNVHCYFLNSVNFLLDNVNLIFQPVVLTA